MDDDAMDGFSLEELKEKFRSLLEIMTCAVCLESVKPKMVQCVKNHLLCIDCRVNLTECPTCKSEFSETEPSHIISQVVEILPTRCKFKNCPMTLTKDDDHEIYCGYQLTNCKLCDWKGLGKEIWEHVSDVHTNETGTLLDKNRKFPDFALYELSRKWFAHLLTKNLFVWEEIVNEPDTEMFTTIWHSVPNGKPELDFFVSMSFESESGHLIKTTIKLDPYPYELTEKNSIPVHHKLLSRFMDENNCLSYNVKISKYPKH